jgi:hypothetical protein
VRVEQKSRENGVAEKMVAVIFWLLIVEFQQNHESHNMISRNTVLFRWPFGFGDPARHFADEYVC